MLSYAQNLEDVLLRRALSDVKDGFYVDVGANHPSIDSVTKHFYLHGWRGVNVEPSAVHALLAAERPLDVNLRAAVSKSRGEGVMYEFEASANSTLSREQAVENRSKFGWDWTERPVQLLPLADLFQEHARGKTVDFLSVDVEGHEREVLESNDWRVHRPRIVLVEATRPCTNEPSHHEWEPLLLAAGYSFAVFDGLNRFYVREEDRERAAALQIHPNLFDGYLRAPHVEHVQGLEERIRYLEGKLGRGWGLLKTAGKPFQSLAKGVKRLFRPRAA